MQSAKDTKNQKNFAKKYCKVFLKVLSYNQFKGTHKNNLNGKQKNKSRKNEGENMKRNATMIKKYVLTKDNAIRNRVECAKLWARYENAQALEEKYNKAYDIAVKNGCKDHEYNMRLLNKGYNFWKLGQKCVDEYFKAYHEMMSLADEGNMCGTIYRMDSEFWAISTR